MMKIFILLFSLSLNIKAQKIELIPQEKKPFFTKVFSQIAYQEVLNISDPISDKPTNTKLLRVYDLKKNHIGFIRDITTTTGCNSACLPVIFTLFYDKNKILIKMLSKPGLTKKYHAPFTEKDYEKMEIILTMNPEVFKKVSYPTQMVDAITGATKSEYISSVVKDAAYSSLRINTYHQQTLNELKNLK